MKGLDALKRLVRDYDYYDNGIDEERHEEDIEIVEKELKVLEIIKNKRVNIQGLFNECADSDIVERYNSLCLLHKTPNRLLTQEEYDLLKEELTDGK